MGVATLTSERDVRMYSPDASRPTTQRIASLDVVRGIVMVLMAIDHVRVYAGVPAGGPTPGVFFTRWVTNFSAPAFAFLAGTGIFLYGRKLGDANKLTRYVVLRGLLLVALELCVLRFAWTFNADVAHYNLAGVIWMLGWCMVLMGALVRMPVTAVGVVGLLIVVAQPVFAPVSQMLPQSIGAFLYLGGGTNLGPFPIDVLYVIVPWIGVMAAGYWFGTVMTRDEAARRKLCLRIGWAMIAMFAVGATAIALRTPAEDGAPRMLFRVLNQRKYPASPLFLLMTLGPTIAFLPAAERMRGWFGRAMATFGRVPMFFYLLHIPAIHLAAVIVSKIREGAVNPWLFGNHPLEPPPVPDGYRWSLPLLYLVFAVVVALLYIPCRWYASARSKDRTGLLRYL